MKIDKFLNLSYLKDGRSFSGVDCYGLCWLFTTQYLKKELPIVLGEDIYSPEKTIETIDKNKHKFNKTQEAKKGDLALFKIKGHATHIGILIDEQRFLHILDEKNSSKIEKIQDEKWRKRLIGLYRYENQAT